MQTVTTRLIYAGRFSTTTLVVVGILLALVVLVTVWHETRSAKRWMIVPLLILRLTALAMVLWMLAEPTMQREVERTHLKSVCLMVDDSASMSVVDEADDKPSVDAVRWASPHIIPTVSGALVGLDGAAVSLGAASKELERLASLWSQPGQREQALASADHVQRLVKDAVGRLDGVASDRTATELVSSVRLSAIRESLSPAGVEGATDLKGDVRRQSSGPDESATVRMTELQRLLSLQAEGVSRLADDTAVQYLQRAEPAVVDRLRAESKFSRRRKVGELIGRAQQDWLREIEQRAKVVRYRFDTQVSGASAADLARVEAEAAEASQAGTDLAAAIRQAALDTAGQALQAVIMLTDGRQTTDGDPLKAAAATAGPPVFVVPIGNTQPVRDVILHHVQAPRSVFKNDRIVFEAMVDAHGYEGDELVVDLLRDDQPVETRRLKTTSDSYVGRISFSFKAETIGTFKFKVRARLMPDEKVRDNNEADQVVEVAEDNIRTLVVDRLPRWEFRYLRNLFKRDPHMEYEDILLEGEEGGRNNRRPTLPATLEDWNRFRIVILGDVGPGDLTPDRQKALARFVEEGGGTLILIAGDDAMPGAYGGTLLERLLPVEMSIAPPAGPEGYGLFVTAEGRMMSAIRLSDDPTEDERIWRERVTLFKISDYAKPKPTSHILIGCVPRSHGQRADDATAAFLCWHYVGRGRVVYLSAPATYRLRQWSGDAEHHLFWGQLLRWTLAREMASGSRTCRLSTDKTGYQDGEEVRVSLRLMDLTNRPFQGAKTTVTAQQDDREIARAEMVEEEQSPGIYKAVFKALPAGEVTLAVAGKEVEDLLAAENVTEPVRTRIRVEPDVSAELRNTRCNLALLKQLADTTGGLVVPPTAMQAAVSQLDLEPKVTRTVSEQPRWTQWRYLWIFVACLAAEWALRKGTGLA